MSELQNQSLSINNEALSQILSRLKVEIIEGVNTKINSNVHNDMKLQELFEKFIEIKRRDVRNTTLTRLEDIYRNHIQEVLGECLLSELTKEKLVQWKATVACKKLSLKMQQNIYGALRQVLNFAVLSDYMEYNILLKVGNFTGRERKIKVKHYTPAQLKRFIHYDLKYSLKTGNFVYYLFDMLLIYTGCRKGEIGALKWSDFINDDSLIISKSNTQKIKGVSDFIDEPKTPAGFRTIVLPKEIIDLLLIYRVAEKRRIEKEGIKWEPEKGYLVRYEKPLRDTTVQKHLDRVVDFANMELGQKECLPHVHPHMFRHSHASMLTHEKVDIVEVSNRLGHSDIKMTLNNYSHLVDDTYSDTINVLNSMHIM